MSETDKNRTDQADTQEPVLTPEEKLDKDLDDSMDASDPPSTTHPDDHGEPAPSSGFKEDGE